MLSNRLKNIKNIKYTANYMHIMKKILDPGLYVVKHNDNGTAIPNEHPIRLPIVSKAKWSFLRAYTFEEIEDALMDALFIAAEKCSRNKEYDAKLSISSITYLMRICAFRTKARATGLNLDGNVPADGRNLHIANMYDKDGNNIIEELGYDENGQLVSSTGPIKVGHNEC